MPTKEEMRPRLLKRLALNSLNFHAGYAGVVLFKLASLVKLLEKPGGDPSIHYPTYAGLFNRIGTTFSQMWSTMSGILRTSQMLLKTSSLSGIRLFYHS